MPPPSSPPYPMGGRGGGEERCLDKYICSIVLIVNYPDMDYEEMKAELASAMRELWKKKGEEEWEETEAKGVS